LGAAFAEACQTMAFFPAWHAVRGGAGGLMAGFLR
jgi:hypothetical protein